MTTQERVEQKEANRLREQQIRQAVSDRAESRRLGAAAELMLWKPTKLNLPKHHFGTDRSAIAIVMLWKPTKLNLPKHHFGADRSAIAIVTGTTVTTVWRVTWRQRLAVLLMGRVWAGVRATAQGVDMFVTAGDPFGKK